MPDIDDEFEQLREQHRPDPEAPGFDLTLQVLLGYIPFLGTGLSAFYNYLKIEQFESRFETFKDHVIDYLQRYGVRRDELEEGESQENIELGGLIVENILRGATEVKVNRFAAVVAHTLANNRQGKDVESASFYIHALEELTEEDLTVLKHLYNHQSRLVNENHAMPYNSFFPAMNDMLMDARELGMQMDDFFARCSRLSGYGLALELKTTHGTMGNPDDLAFRLTLIGKRLIEMLIVAGEDMRVTRQRQQ